MRFEGKDLSREIGGRTLYRDLSFELEEGEVLAIRGASGSGKTRLLRQLAALDPLEGGVLRLDGRSPSDLGFTRWRSEVCLVPQPAPIFAGAPAELLERIGALKAQRNRPSTDPRGIASDWGLPAERWEQPWKELSLGERQRALLAILLSREPRVLLLDEPTATLDPDSVAAVEESLAMRTCVWVTHHPEQAERMGTRILTIGGESRA
jgi:ABC-type multidrug transport system ATPase subunit